MTSRDRVLRALGGQSGGRTPINVFAGWNPGIRQTTEAKYGSTDAFCRTHRIDIVTGVLPRFPFGRRGEVDLPDEVEDFLDLQPLDPAELKPSSARCDGDLFPTVAEAVVQSDYRAVFAHAWGVFELSQFLFEEEGKPGTETALLNMLAERDACKELFATMGRWTAACVADAIEAGADVIELSDDWGQQNTMLFSPDLWWELVYEPTKHIIDTAHGLGAPVLIHSDGDITLVLDGVKESGADGLHPVQESAGMNPETVRKVLGPEFCIMGGLDTVTALPVMSEDEIRDEVRRVFDVFGVGGPFIFAGSHMFQDDADLAVIEAGYEEAMRLAERRGIRQA